LLFILEKAAKTAFTLLTLLLLPNIYRPHFYTGQIHNAAHGASGNNTGTGLGGLSIKLLDLYLTFSWWEWFLDQRQCDHIFFAAFTALFTLSETSAPFFRPMPTLPLWSQ